MGKDAPEAGNPLFSIIIPAYNRADIIRGTIESVLAQSFRDFEVIFVDDGSSDGTAEVAKASGDERFRCFTTANQERLRARNFGARQARGRYINFLDSDDRLYPDHLAEAAALIARHGEPEVFHLGFEIKTPAGVVVRRIDDLSGDVDEELARRGSILHFNGLFLRKDVAMANPINEDVRLIGSEEYELCMRLAARFPIRYSNVVTSVVVDHPGRSVLHSDKGRLIGRYDAFMDSFRTDGPFAARYGRHRARMAADFMSYIALHLALLGDKSGSIEYLWRCCSAYPPAMFTKRFGATLKRLIVDRGPASRS